MVKALSRFVCQTCGTISLKWTGRCDACHAWNTLAQETVEKKSSTTSSMSLSFVSLKDPFESSITRWTTQCSEFDRVCGGGIVPGSVILVGGDPGIGKSTLMLQISAALSLSIPTAYISGEEGVDQIRLRALRLGLGEAPVSLASGTHIHDIISSLQQSFKVVVIDSIQTMMVSQLDAAPGTVSQIRASTQELVNLAKKNNIAIILIGHVTKEGMIAGPRVLEHMVDTVLYFEGERGHPFRLLRAVKNRFGATDEIGVFDMTDKGLQEVKNPSALFLSHRQEQIPGACIFAGIEGTRPLLVEIQALVSPSYLTNPRRAVVGWDHNRLSMILAILETHCKFAFSGKDVFLNVVGGLRICEPAADLAVAAALLSCLRHKPLPSTSVVFGEMGLSGEIRRVNQTEIRLKEAQKLGFTCGFVPQMLKSTLLGDTEMTLRSLKHIRDLVHWFSS